MSTIITPMIMDMRITEVDITITDMTDRPVSSAGLGFLHLLSWVSPAFPTGGYAYSHGLEWAVECGDVRDVRDVRTLCAWVSSLFSDGAPASDLIFLQEAWRAAEDPVRLRDLAAFACACASSRERYEETVYQGEAFLKAASVWNVVPDPSDLKGVRWPLPVAQGLVFGRGGIACEQALLSGAYTMAAALVSAAVRLVPLGQTDGLKALVTLEHDLALAVERTCRCTLEDVGGACFRSDLAAMHHETQTTRLFRT